MTAFHRQVFLMELRKLVAYRADFWANFVGQTFFSLIIAYYLWMSIFSYAQSSTLQGHNLQYMIFYYLMVPLIFRIQQGESIGFMAREIYEGGLNKYLLYPIDYFEYKLATYLANAFFYFLQLLLILLIYNIFFYDPNIYTFSIVNLILFFIAILMATLCFFYLFAIAELMAFWFDNTWSLGVLLRFLVSFLGGALIPLSFFPTWTNDFLYFTPFPYLIDFPMNSLLGSISMSAFLKNIFISFCWLVVFKLLSTYVMNKGKYSYSGVGI